MDGWMGFGAMDVTKPYKFIGFGVSPFQGMLGTRVHPHHGSSGPVVPPSHFHVEAV